MSFAIAQFDRMSGEGLTSLNNLWGYYSDADDLATIVASAYFNTIIDKLAVSDLIYIKGTDGVELIRVTSVTTNVTVEGFKINNIADGVITNAMVNAAAAIDFSKLAALADGSILIGSAATVPTAQAVSGVITLSNAGVTAFAAGAIVNADINAAAAIDFSKLAALADGNILVGSAGNVATSVAMSGDVAIDNTGATTIQAGAIDLAMLSAGIAPSHVVKFADQLTTVGGAAAEAFTVTGVLATDLAFVQMVDQGTGVVTALIAVCTNDTLTVTFSANPQNDAIFNYQILRAAV